MFLITPMIAEIVSGGPLFGDQNLAKWASFSLSKTQRSIAPGRCDVKRGGAVLDAPGAFQNSW
jgi:hypothetical protein